MLPDNVEEQFKGKVIVWYPFTVGGQLADRWMWMSEKDGEVIDYHRKDVLIEQALAGGEEVVVLRKHKNGTYSVMQSLPNNACSGLAGTARLESEVSQPANR